MKSSPCIIQSAALLEEAIKMMTSRTIQHRYALEIGIKLHAFKKEVSMSTKVKCRQRRADIWMTDTRRVREYEVRRFSYRSGREYITGFVWEGLGWTQNSGINENQSGL